MEEIIHNDLKRLLAELNRLENFEEYLRSDEFQNILLENGDDDFWEKNISYTGILGTQKYNRTYINCLNYLLNYWLNNDGHNYVASKLNRFLKYVILGYICFNKENKDFSKLLRSIYFGPVTEETINEIEEVINSKVYQKIIKVDVDKATNVKIEMEKEEYDYAIITALEDDEMDKILEVATIEKELENGKYFIRKGYFNSNPNKKILFVSQNFTGFVDSAILTAEIISKYKIKLIIMPGVLGGNPKKTNFGDVIIANKVFTIDKGKIEKDNFNYEIESSNINNRHINKIKSNRQKIIDYIRDNHSENKVIDIHFEPIACVRQVINKVGYFEENILSIERKAIGVEMESYGVLRATELANEGKTNVLIIKSVMDKTEEKGDNYKKFASFTSARTVEYLFKENLV